MVPADRNIVLEIQDICAVEADPDRVFQVLANLVVNAVRHGAGTISVTVRRDGACGVLEVSDEGGGVPTNRLEELFKPFSHWGGHSDSSGLGLAIARGIIESHGGSLHYRQHTDVRQHAFEVRLPLLDTEISLSPLGDHAAAGRASSTDDAPRYAVGE